MPDLITADTLNKDINNIIKLNDQFSELVQNSLNKAIRDQKEIIHY